MERKHVAGRNKGWRAGLGITIAAMGTTAGCTSKDLNAILAGVQVTTDQLVNNRNNISFADWLQSQLK